MSNRMYYADRDGTIYEPAVNWFDPKIESVWVPADADVDNLAHAYNDARVLRNGGYKILNFRPETPTVYASGTIVDEEGKKVRVVFWGSTDTMVPLKLASNPFGIEPQEVGEEEEKKADVMDIVRQFSR